ncbi:MAG: O-antigen ligase family protein, partial [Thermodesulfobacteriota bacterium]
MVSFRRSALLARDISLSQRLDHSCIFLASLIPIGVMVGPVIYDGFLSLVVLLWLTRLAISRDGVVLGASGRAVLIPYLAWYGAIVLSLLVNVAPSLDAWGHDIGFVRFLLFIVALVDISGRHNVVRPLIFGLLAFVLYAWFNYLMVVTMGHDLAGKEIFYYQDNQKIASRIASVGQFAATFFACWALNDRDLSGRKKISLWVFAIAVLLLIFVVGSRTAVISSASGLFCAFLFWGRRKIVVHGLAGAGLGLAIVAVLHFIFNDNQLDIRLNTLYHRLDIWRVSIHIWLDRPIFGTSVAEFKAVFEQVTASTDIFATGQRFCQLITTDKAYHAHNLVIQLLTATGLVGYLTFCWLFVAACRAIVSDFRGWRVGLLVWPVVMLVEGLTGHDIYASDYQPLVAYFLVLII